MDTDLDTDLGLDLGHALGLDPERLAADADRFFDRLGPLPDADEPVRAESRDGLVSVEYSGAAGVRELRLDPRAMRMDSARLAETIVGVIRQARERAEAEERERSEAFLGAARALLADRDLIADRLRDVTPTLQENLERAGATIDRVRALLRP
ncbi:hypothetical protein GCM10022224_004070 [Nonomuraea antimicrobica]|uniref:YbaB/EbfC DNA-binding family protein n=1 Tax=Nonomuraea antimicrobica TaxID=561173 RepID=A0ABP7AZT6_9ACTN